MNPRDSLAQAVLIGLHKNVGPLRGESQIKLLLREEPEADLEESSTESADSADSAA